MSKFHFVLKTPKSASLSHSDENEQYNIRSHAQTRRRAASRSPVPKAAPTARGLPHRLGADGTLTFQSRSTSSLIDLDRGASETSPGAATRTSVWHHGFRHVVTTEHGWNPLSFLSRNTFDPFNSTILEQDSTTFQVFQFATSDFSNVNFRAESLCLVPSSADEYRHTEAISQRTQLALGNEMVMSTTLAYASAAMGWRFGIRYQQRPPEYFIQQAYTAIRCRLFQSMDVDNVLVMCIYSLAASEMWVKNYTAARTHLRMLGQMIQSMGGIAKLEPYVMDSVILGTKFLALFTNTVPILSLDWEPDNRRPETTQEASPDVLPVAANPGERYLTPDNTATIGVPLQMIIHDIRSLWEMSHWVWAQPTSNASDERYLYLKVQAMAHRLLSMKFRPGLQESLRLALSLWLLSVTDYVGAKVAAVETLHFLRAAEEDASTLTETETVEILRLQLWISSLGAMISIPASATRCGQPQGCQCDSHEQADFFINNVHKIARILDVPITRDAIRKFLEGYFYWENRQGTALSRLVQTMSGTYEAGEAVT